MSHKFVLICSYLSKMNFYAQQIPPTTCYRPSNKHIHRIIYRLFKLGAMVQSIHNFPQFPRETVISQCNHEKYLVFHNFSFSFLYNSNDGSMSITCVNKCVTFDASNFFSLFHAELSLWIQTKCQKRWVHPMNITGMNVRMNK